MKQKLTKERLILFHPTQRWDAYNAPSTLGFNIEGANLDIGSLEAQPILQALKIPTKIKLQVNLHAQPLETVDVQACVAVPHRMAGLVSLNYPYTGFMATHRCTSLYASRPENVRVVEGVTASVKPLQASLKKVWLGEQVMPLDDILNEQWAIDPAARQYTWRFQNQLHQKNFVVPVLTKPPFSGSCSVLIGYGGAYQRRIASCKQIYCVLKPAYNHNTAVEVLPYLHGSVSDAVHADPVMASLKEGVPVPFSIEEAIKAGKMEIKLCNDALEVLYTSASYQECASDVGHVNFVKQTVKLKKDRS